MVETAEWSMVLADAREARRARPAIRRFLAMEATPDSDLDAVETIVGELVANVIRHASGAIGIHVSWHGNSATLIVADRGPGIPPVRSVPDARAEQGRGLFLVASLARRVEITAPPGGGTCVQVELPVWSARRTAERTG